MACLVKTESQSTRIKTVSVQGDTTQTVRISLMGYPDVGSPNWEAFVILKEHVSGNNVFEKPLDKTFSKDGFIFNLTPQETLTLFTGTYSVFVIVSNLLDYEYPIRKHVIIGEHTIQNQGIS